MYKTRYSSKQNWVKIENCWYFMVDLSVSNKCTNKNIMITDDREELRADRAVKVSKKELNMLVAELFECTDMMSSDDEDPRTQQQENPTLLDQDQPVEEEVSLLLLF
jgi:hypothetical protein